MVDVVLQVTYIYMLTLLLALIVERMLEVLNAGWNFLEWRFEMHRFWTRRAQILQAKFEQYAYSRLWHHFVDLSGLLFQLRKVKIEDKAGHSGVVPIISGDLVRNTAMMAVNRSCAVGLGILFCFLTHINLVKVVATELKIGYTIITGMPAWLGMVISGVFIGAGSEPVHHAISALEKRRKS